MGEDEDTTAQVNVKTDMKLESYLKLGDEIITAKNECSKAGCMYSPLQTPCIRNENERKI